MPRVASAIPVGTQFSPKVVDLKEFLKVVIQESGKKEAMRKRIWTPPVRLADVKRDPTHRRGNLPLEAAIQYGLLDKGYHATPLARDLSKLGEEALYAAFARHILQNLGGLRVVEAAQQMALDQHVTGVAVTGDSLAAYLSSQGFRVTIHNTAINSMRMWLAKAGVFSQEGWNVDAAAKARVLGLTDDQIAALVGLTDPQKAFALALCRLNPKGDFPANQVRELAEGILADLIDRGSLPKLMKPLSDAGFIEVDSGGTQKGKSATLRVTDAFRRDVLQPFLERTVKDMDAVVTAYYREDLAAVMEKLDSKDAATKGRALEAYVIQVMRILGLRFVKWRLRAPDTGNAEVDVVMAGVMGMVPTRWQVQCKNTHTPIRLEDIAKEVGLLSLTKATHILILSRGGFTRDAIRYAHETMRNSAVTLFLLDEEDFEAIRASRGGALAGILRSRAETVLDLPRSGLESLGA